MKDAPVAQAKRRFSGWRPEKSGWLFGLSAPQLTMLTVACAWPLLGLSQGRWSAVVLGTLVAGAVFGLTVYRPGGRPAGAWVFAYLLWWYSEMKKWNVFQSRVAAGDTVLVDGAADLPGALGRLRWHDGQPVNGVRPCLIEDPVENTWTAVARVEHPGMGLATEQLEAQRIAGHAKLQAAIATEGGFVRKIVEYARTTPDDGTEAASWQAANLSASAPPGALATVERLGRVASESGVQQEYFLAVVIDGARARRAAAAASKDPVEGYGRIVARELAGLEAAIQEAGFSRSTWLGTDGVAAALLTGFCPSEAADLSANGLAAAAAGLPASAMPLAAAGPTGAYNARRYYQHDDSTSASFGVILPELPMYLDALAALLVPGSPGERRCLAVHFEPVAASRADRAVSNEIFRREVAAETKRAKKFRVPRKERKALAEAEKQEAQLAAGHALTRLAVVVTVTVPSDRSIMDAAAGLRAAARNRRLLLRPLDLAQDAGFFAGVIPVGMGLPRLRGMG